MEHKQDTSLTILVVEQDDKTRPLLRYNLRSQSYRVLMALDEEDAIERTWGGRECPDVILINQVKLSIDEFIDMGRRIRQIAGFPIHTPIIVMAERYGPELEGKDIKVGESEYITYLEDAQQLMNLLHRLWCERPLVLD